MANISINELMAEQGLFTELDEGELTAVMGGRIWSWGTRPPESIIPYGGPIPPNRNLN